MLGIITALYIFSIPLVLTILMITIADIFRFIVNSCSNYYQNWNTPKSEVSQTFKEYSRDVNLKNKSVKSRGSDSNLLKFIYNSMPDGSDYLLNSRMIATEKMDGTQFWFKIDENGISEMRTHNGFMIGPDKQYQCVEDFPIDDFNYQRINIGAHFNNNFHNYMGLFDYFKSIHPDIKHCHIFMEIMLPISPCKITYPDEMKDKFYIFQVNLSNKVSYRVNYETRDIFSHYSLDTVPIVGEFEFNITGVTELVNWIKETDREGVIVELISNTTERKSQYFKLKNGSHDTSTFANRFTEKMYQDSRMKDIIKCLIELANSNVTTDTQNKRNKAMVKTNPRDAKIKEIQLLMEKEITHNDWKNEYKNLDRSQYSNFIERFTVEIEKKLELENSYILDTDDYKKIIKKRLFSMLK